jgi:NTE family protein
MAAKPQRADLVLAGGGVKGIAHVGAVAQFLGAGYEFQRVAGASAGSLVGALVAAGMTASRMEEVLMQLDYRRFRDHSPRDRIPLVGPALSVLLEEGVYEGDYIREWMADQLAALGVRTFGDLRMKDRGSSLPPDQQYKLVVMVTDLTRGELVRLPWDYRDHYGLDPDEQPVADAVRASSSIPFFFEPVRLRHANGESVLVDGGVLTNYPIDVFDRTDLKPPRWPTFGVTLLPPLPAGTAQLFPGVRIFRQAPPLRLLESLLTTMVVGHDQTNLAKPWIRDRTVAVPTESVNIVDFGIGRDEQKLLYGNGQQAAKAFLDRWDWDRYRVLYRGATATVG